MAQGRGRRAGRTSLRAAAPWRRSKQCVTPGQRLRGPPPPQVLGVVEKGSSTMGVSALSARWVSPPGGSKCCLSFPRAGAPRDGDSGTAAPLAAKLTPASPSSLPQSQVQPFGLNFFVLSTRRSISSALPFVPAGFSPLRTGMALKILLIMAGEHGRVFWSTPGVSCAAYTRWANKHLA